MTTGARPVVISLGVSLAVPQMVFARADCAACSGGLVRAEENPPFPAGSAKRMNGLEPSTFCMATS